MLAKKRKRQHGYPVSIRVLSSVTTPVAWAIRDGSHLISDAISMIVVSETLYYSMTYQRSFFVLFCRKLTEYQVTNDGANIQIVLDRAGQIFTNGSEVSGHVVITAMEPLSYDQVIVTLKGEGKVFFPQNIHGKLALRRKQVHPKYAGHHHGEVYCSKSKVLLNNRNQLVEQTLPVGEHKFPFHFKLTGSRLPSSFKGPLGYISYYVGAKVAQISSKKDIVATVEIPFVETVDINVNQLLKPVYEERETTVHNLLGRESSPITLRVQLDRSAYCVGEEIKIQAEVQNGSGRNVSLQTKLVRKGQFIAGQHQVKHPSVIVATASGPSVASGGSSQWRSDSLVIPPTEPTIDTSSYISLYYVLKVSLVIPRARNCTIKIPITIGNVPLGSSVHKTTSRSHPTYKFNCA